ncbi:hypothetical protein GCM10027092_15520 [Yaniella soli]
MVGFGLDTIETGKETDEDAVEEDIFDANMTDDVTSSYEAFFEDNQDDGFVAEEDLSDDSIVTEDENTDDETAAQEDASALADTGADNTAMLAAGMLLALAGAGAVYANQRRNNTQNS